MGFDGAIQGGVEGVIESLAHEPSPLKRRQILLGAREAWSTETVGRFYDEAVRRAHVDLPQAERMARSALWLATQIGDEGARATALRAMGNILERKRRYVDALKQFEEALEIYERLGNEMEVARTLNFCLHCMIYLGRYDDALVFASRAEDIFARHGDTARLARLYGNIGNLLHRQDRFDEAMERYRRAYAGLIEAGDPRDVAVALQNMATCQISMNDFRQALDTYERTRRHCVEHELPLLVAVADYNIAYLYYLRGEYTRAIELYRSAREHCQRLGDAYREALCDLDQSEMYVELNLNEEGAHLARRAMTAFQKLGNGYEAAKALTNLAISLSHHGDSQLALNLFRKARDLFTREGNESWIAIIDLYQALVFYQERRLTEARLLAESAFEYFSPGSLQGKAILCQLLLARIHLESGRADRAKGICRNALAKLDHAETPALSYQSFFVLGLIEEELGDRESAYQAYLTAHRHLESLRSHLRTEDTKIAFLKDKLEVYESLVRMCLARGDTKENREAALVYIEQAKSRSLADLIAFRAQDLPASHETHRALVDQVKTLREELNWYSRAIQLQESRSGGARDPKIDRLRRNARDCEHRLVEAMGHLRVEDREFANLQAAGSIDLDAIRAALPEDAMLLQYYRVRDTFHAAMLTRSSLKIAPAGSVTELRKTLQLLRFQLSKFRLGPAYVKTFHSGLLEAAGAHLQESYRQLIAPIAKDLTAEHLIIAPHDFLHYLPFQALLDGADYLGRRHSISYTPSASVYYLCCTKPTRGSTGSLVLGVPNPSAPQIREEVEAVSAVLPDPEVYVGPDATLEVLRERGARARYVHIATHGWFRQDNPMFSSISLGNSQLSLFDLYHLNLPAELVTLSGCGTGLNVVVGGDELMGLKRGLLYAGAEGLLLTLWDVHDQSTAEFMRLFYSRLKSNPDKAKAAQHATEEIRRAYPHPFYWAPFVLVGKYRTSERGVSGGG
jgi:CHAT domain-containing protein/tetratricopeptide (TPR) repeat protein